MAVNLSAANKSFIEKASATKPVTTSPMILSENTSETKKIDKKKLACSIGAALGAVALAATVIHFVKKGNAKGVKDAVNTVGKAGKQVAETAGSNISEKASEVSTQFEKGIKKFFNGETLVDGVKLEKGKALNADGSVFSGVMKTMLNDGSTVAIEYADGFMTSSTKNGKLIKTFDEFGQGLTRNQGVHITKYLDSGKTEDIYETFHDSGKLKKFIKPVEYNLNGTKYKSFRAKQYNEKGVLTAETFVDNHKTKFLTGNFFDEDGKLESSIVTNRYGGLDKVFYSEDGTVVKKYSDGIMTEEKNVFSENISPSDYVNPTNMKIFNQDGKVTRVYSVQSKDGPNAIIDIADIADNNSNWALVFPKHEKLDLCGAQTENIFQIRAGDKTISLGKDGIKTEGGELSKKDIKQMIEKVKEFFGDAKDNGLMDNEIGVAQYNGLGEFANLKRYENLIQQFEESAKKL